MAYFKTKEGLLKEIQELETKALSEAKIISDLKDNGMGCQSHDDRFNRYLIEMKLRTRQFLKIK